jgi:hypothetical protein
LDVDGESLVKPRNGVIATRRATCGSRGSTALMMMMRKTKTESGHPNVESLDALSV